MLTECLERAEALLVADAADKGYIQGLVIEIARKVEQMGLDRDLSIGQNGRTMPDIGDSGARGAIGKAGNGGIYARGWDEQLRSDTDIGGTKTDGTSYLLTPTDAALKHKMAGKEATSCRNITRKEGATDDRAADSVVRKLGCKDDFDPLLPTILAVLLKAFARLWASKVVIIADDEGADIVPLGKMDDELVRGEACHLPVKGQYDGATEATSAEQLQFLRSSGKQQRGLATKDDGGMLIKGQRHGIKATLGCMAYDLVDEVAVPDMDTIKATYGSKCGHRSGYVRGGLD